jgi:hypothetical protein
MILRVKLVVLSWLDGIFVAFEINVRGPRHLP